MVWSGLLCGLLAFQAMRIWQASYVAAAVEATRQAEDLYAEARRSRAILEKQDGAPPSALDSQASPGETAPAVIAAEIRVIDGDTFAYGATRIRIADIDTPEVEGRCAGEVALAARATARLRALLAAGPFELHPSVDGRDEDGYGRKLRIVTRHGRSLGDVLVAEGLARTWTGRREPWCT
jgi:endonuclease YncB( thermonuclease family)